jgi:hypothetical protein
VAFEILSSEIEEIDREIVHHEDLLASLFDFFKDTNANPLLANLAARIISSLMNSRLAGVSYYHPFFKPEDPPVSSENPAILGKRALLSPYRLSF